jgi:hypothetical protein
MNFKSYNEEGLYLLHFYNCYQFLSKKFDGGNELAVNLTVSFCFFKTRFVLIYIYLKLELVEKNEDSYLSAGEIPVPILYLTWAIIYFLASISWIYILKTSKFVEFFYYYVKKKNKNICF